MTIRLEDFWPELERELARAPDTFPSYCKAPTSMAFLLDEFRGIGPHVEADIAMNAEHRALFDRALKVRDGSGPTLTVITTE